MRLFPHNLILSVFTLLDRPVTWITHCRHCISVQTTDLNLLSRSGHHAAILPHVNLNETWTAWNLLLSSEIKKICCSSRKQKECNAWMFWKIYENTVESDFWDCLMNESSRASQSFSFRSMAGKMMRKKVFSILKFARGTLHLTVSDRMKDWLVDEDDDCSEFSSCISRSNVSLVFAWYPLIRNWCLRR